MLYAPPQLVQTAFAEITQNVSTSSTSYTDLDPLSLTLVTDANPIEVYFTLCAEVVYATSDIGCILVVDGSVVIGTRGRVGAYSFPEGYMTCPSIRYKSPRLAAGSHTVKIQWRSSGIFTSVQVRPEDYIWGSGSLLVKEVTV